MSFPPPSPASSVRSDRFTSEFRFSSSRLGLSSVPTLQQLSLNPRTDAGRPRKNASSTPHNPDWLRERPYMSLEYLRSSAQINSSMPSSHRKGDALSMTQLSTPLQELLLVEDMLYALMGIEGRYVKASIDEATGGVRFVIDPTTALDPSLIALTCKILPLCHSYVRIGFFVETYSRYECGLVNHALCAAIRSMLQDYYIFIAQLETQFRAGKLNIQRLWYYTQPCLGTLGVVDRIIEDISRTQSRGGITLNKIYHFLKKNEGDPRSRDICNILLQKASVPFFEMISGWIYNGLIKDPYDEFMIEEHEEFRKDLAESDFNEAESYWEQRYVLRPDYCPIFLHKIATEILTAGKYLNVIRECGRQIQAPQERISYAVQEKEYIEKIESAYQFASSTLLDLLMKEMQLLPRLRSIKHYFLLDHGDFLVHFLDIAEPELQKAIADVDMSKFESLLDLSIRSSISSNDPFRDDVVCDFLSYSLVRQLMVMHTSAQNLKNPNGMSF
eukprot:TRINITY_DN6645_c0_g2_i1.p1 TRINITY_DN6645_c0_g2~~TRINITY_DN6645_c0_g2_i1.p1  ORF type:complete len:501 (-),score=90.25 TRINITY_DN6645_c0_g2_i1:148-1650(-)